MIVDCALYRDGQRRNRSPERPGDALAAARTERDAFVWVELHDPDEEVFERLVDDFGLHPLAVEDALTTRQRPKLEAYDESLFVVLKTVNYRSGEEAISVGYVMVFLGRSFAITVRHGPTDVLTVARRHLESRPEVLRHGPAAVLYAVSDAVVDHYLRVALDVHDDLEELEERVFTPGSGNLAERIYSFKRQVLYFHRAVLPLLEPMQRLCETGVLFVPESAAPFFRDVTDHLNRVHEQIDGVDRMLSDIVNANLAQVSVQQNDDMRKISAWAAMAAIPTAIAGIYGMDFENMPELRLAWAYPGVLLLMVLACVILYWVFKRNRWL